MRKTKLTVLGIKQKKRKKLYKKRQPKTCNSSVQVSRATQSTACQTKSSYVKTRDVAVETEHRNVKNVYVAVDTHFFQRDKWTNPKRLYPTRQSTQTERDTWSIETQCMVSRCTRETQSENSRVCMPTQTEMLVFNKTTQTSANDTVDVDNLQNQFKYSLHIFNELCQMLLMQNNLLNSNFTMVYKLADVIHYKHIQSTEKLNVEKM